MFVNLSPAPTVVRQTCNVALAGLAPELAGKAYLPFYVGHIYRYADPDDQTLETLDQGGLIDLSIDTAPVSGAPTTLQPAYIITEFRALAAAGNVIISVEDRDSTHAIECYNGSGTYQVLTPIVVLPSQRIKVTTANAGWIDLYVRKASVL